MFLVLAGERFAQTNDARSDRSPQQICYARRKTLVRVFKLLLLGSCILLLTLAPGAKASVWDQKVVATFNGPVEIPGQILPSGTYVMKVLNVTGTRDIVQVTNADETRVLATAF